MVQHQPTRSRFQTLRWVSYGVVVLTAFGVSSQAAAGPSRAQAAASKSVWEGVYTADQSKKGQEIASANCVVCHGDSVAGSDLAPALLGEDFRGAWRDRTVGELFEKIQTTMPADRPGTLTGPQVAELIAYIFRLNEFPAGDAALATAAAQLNNIRIRQK
jgi:mono/diheme cytochrome c family protein